MSGIFLALGLVLAVEGLVLALAPRRIEDVLQFLAQLTVEQRRLVGLGAVALGVLAVWMVRGQVTNAFTSL